MRDSTEIAVDPFSDILRLANAQSVVSGGLTAGVPSTPAGAVSANIAGARFNGTVGLPLPSTEVSIRDDDGCELPPEREGEICVRGPQVMQGYWNRPAETAAAFFEGGWFRTGDIGTLDPRGYLRITDRKKDMINVSGFKVFPTEVESVIAEIPGVLECGVIGVPDGIGGEVVKAVITEQCRTHPRTGDRALPRESDRP